MSNQQPPDPLLDAAAQVGDGQVVTGDQRFNVDQRRVVGNLAKLARLRGAFAGLIVGTPDTAARNAADAPAEWGHLRIVEELGRGGYGVVYRAFDPVLQREVALKLHRTAGPSTLDSTNYIEEARRLARVRHPNVLAVHGADINDGRVGLWSDLLNGETLDSVLDQEGAFARARVPAIAQQLVAAVQAIHTAGLVHGDIKAANVMLCEDKVVLMDFGAGSEIGAHPRYASPSSTAAELLRGEPATVKSDVWSLGALLYRMATGRGLPVDAQGAVCDTPSLAPARAKIGAPLSALVLRMLSPEPGRRPDAKQIARELQRIEGLPRQRRRRLAMAVVIGSLCVGLLVSLFALQRVREERTRSQTATNFLVESVNAVRPIDLDGPASLSALFDYMAEQAEPKLSEYPFVLAQMWVIIGKGIAEFGDSARGLALAERGLALMREQAPKQTREIADVLAVISVARKNQGDLAGAESAARESIALFQSLSSSDVRLEIIRVRGSLANMLLNQGRWIEAAAEHRDVLADRTRLLGKGDPGLAVDHNNLAVALLRLNRNKEARDHFLKADALLEAGGAELGAMHRNYVRQGLAFAESELGNFADADQLLKHTLEAYRHIVPPDHVIVQKCLVGLAELKRRQGDVVGALSILQSLPDTFYAKNPNARLRLSHALRDSGQLQQAFDAAQPLQVAMAKAHDPRAPYVDALLAYLSYRIGDTATPPLAEIHAALDSMREHGYGELDEAQELETWRAALTPVDRR